MRGKCGCGGSGEREGGELQSITHPTHSYRGGAMDRVVAYRLRLHEAHTGIRRHWWLRRKPTGSVLPGGSVGSNLVRRN